MLQARAEREPEGAHALDQAGRQRGAVRSVPPEVVLRSWELGGGNLISSASSREHLSHTRISAFLACPQKYEFSYTQRLEPRRRSEALTLGSAYQLSIEHADPEHGAALLALHAKVLGQSDADRLAVQQTIVASAAELYLTRFPAPAGNAVKEFGYRVRLRSPYTGRMSRTFDLLGFADEWRDLGSHAALVENKLVGQINAASIRKLPLDRQIALECYGTWRATGLEVREVFYRYVKKPSIKQKKNESIEEFCQRLRDDYQERADFYCHEEHMIRTSDDLLRVEEELWSWGQQLQWLRRQSVATRNSTHCADFGGCAYMSLCLGEPGAEGLYVTRQSDDTRVPRASTEQSAISADSTPEPDELPF